MKCCNCNKKAIYIGTNWDDKLNAETEYHYCRKCGFAFKMVESSRIAQSNQENILVYFIRWFFERLPFMTPIFCTELIPGLDRENIVDRMIIVNELENRFQNNIKEVQL